MENNNDVSSIAEKIASYLGGILVIVTAIWGAIKKIRKSAPEPAPTGNGGNGNTLLKEYVAAQKDITIAQAVAFEKYTAGGIGLLAQAQQEIEELKADKRELRADAEKEIEELQAENKMLRIENKALGDQLEEWQGKSARQNENVERQNKVIEELKRHNRPDLDDDE